VNISTTRFGAVEGSHQQLIVLSQGLIGFPLLTRFVAIESDEGSMFRWWQAVDAPDTAFVVLDPLSIVPDYDLRGLEVEWSDLGVDDPALRQVVVVVTAPGPTLESVTLNLAAPILINPTTRQGRQVVFPDERYAVAVRFDDAVALKGSVELAA
jgi:flagellar assembly factor FliW